MLKAIRLDEILHFGTRRTRLFAVADFQLQRQYEVDTSPIPFIVRRNAPAVDPELKSGRPEHSRGLARRPAAGKVEYLTGTFPHTETAA